MIQIKIGYASNHQINFLEVKGHSGSGPYGHDIVCAGVSAVITGGFNNLNNVKQYEIQLTEGYALFKCDSEIDAHDEIVLETIVCGLTTIQESYSDFVKIKSEK